MIDQARLRVDGLLLGVALLAADCSSGGQGSQSSREPSTSSAGAPSPSEASSPGFFPGAFVRTCETSVYTAIAIDFPAPAVPQQPIRQNYIEVYESLWVEGDPLMDFQADMAQQPVQGKAIYDLGGVPALGVTAHSPSVAERSNAAFLRLVLNGLEVTALWWREPGHPHSDRKEDYHGGSRDGATWVGNERFRLSSR